MTIWPRNCLFKCMLFRFGPTDFLFALGWCAVPALGHESPVIEVVGHYDNAIGIRDAASEGAIGAELLHSRALLRPAEVLEYIPGMVVTQHSGDGKANQYFLRGMNLDHGTDFATTLNGVPLNLPTHAHGQGYTDLNALIPELVARVDYRKGPYFASEGDFASAGSAHIVYRQRLERPMVAFTLGQHGYQRGLVAGSRDVSQDTTLLMALEQQHNHGPWTVPEGLRKTNAWLTLSGGSAREGWSGSLSTYRSRWTATDQVPQRLIEAGSHGGQAFGRFDSLDASDGGDTQRTSLSARWHQALAHGLTRVEAYAVRYALQLYSNFTYSLDRDSDQFAQTDQRTIWGVQASRNWLADLGEGRLLQNTLGIQLRQDRLRVGLYDTQQRQIQRVVREDGVRQTLAGVYAENEIGWTPWLRSVVGLRADQLEARVVSHLQASNSGSASATRMSPKFSLVLGPWQKTAFYFNAGRGFHSNDARGVTAHVDPRSGQALEPVTAMAGSRGHEIGLQSHLIANLQTSLAIWQLALDSELVYVGDAGNTEAGRASRRTGIEWTQHWTPSSQFWLDGSLAWTRPRYVDGALAGASIPNAVQKLAHLSLTWRHAAAWSGSLGVRYIGAAPLVEDNSVRSSSSVTANLRIQHTVSHDLDLALDVLNLTNRQNNDISYYYTSRLAGEPAAGVADVHVHPAEPRTLRLTARLRY